MVLQMFFQQFFVLSQSFYVYFVYLKNIIPVGFTYATYGGLTITAVTIFGILKYNQLPNIYGTIGIVLIIIGVILVNYLGKVSS